MFERDSALSHKAVKIQNDASSVHMLEYWSLKHARLILVNETFKVQAMWGGDPFKKQPVGVVKMVLRSFLKLHTKGRTFHHPIGCYPITLKCGGGLHLKME